MACGGADKGLDPGQRDRVTDKREHLERGAEARRRERLGQRHNGGLDGRVVHLGQHIDIAEVESMAGIYNGPEALMAVYQWRVTRRTGHHALDFPYPNCILR